MTVGETTQIVARLAWCLIGATIAALAPVSAAPDNVQPGKPDQASNSALEDSYKRLAEQIQAHAGYSTRIEGLLDSSTSYSGVHGRGAAFTFIRTETDAVEGGKPVATAYRETMDLSRTFVEEAAQPTGTGIRDDKRTLYAVELFGPIEQVEETEGKSSIRKLLRSSRIIFTDEAKATAVARLLGSAISLCRVEKALTRRAEAGLGEKVHPDSMLPSAAETAEWLAEKITTRGGYVVEANQSLLGKMTQKVSYSDFRQQGATLTVTETERLKFSRDGKEAVTTRKVVIDLKNVRCWGEAEKAPVSFAPVGKYFAAVIEAGAKGAVTEDVEENGVAAKKRWTFGQIFVFEDTEMAGRVAKALKHLIALQRTKAEPF